MRIGIDARFLTHPQPGGFKTYTENLVDSLAKVDTENEYILYVDRHPYPGCNIPVNPNFVSKVVPGLFPIIGMPFREQLGLVLQTRNDRVELFHSPCLTAPLRLSCPLVITIHDMIWAFPEKFSGNTSRSLQRSLMEWYNRLIPKRAASRASAIITVSHAAKKSIVDALALGIDQVFVTHEAASSAFQVVSDAKRLESARQKYALPSKYVLAIGSADPRKNLSTLVEAYSLLSKELQENHPLVILWTNSSLAGALSRQIEGLSLTNRVRFLEKVPTDELILLYNAASLFVFPSLYEGFGLPPLEAMASGAPVIAADNSSIPEIVGDAALLFDAQDVDEISSLMKRVLMNDPLRLSMSEKGLVRAASFSWEKCAHETLAVYKMVMENSQ